MQASCSSKPAALWYFFSSAAPCSHPDSHYSRPRIGRHVRNLFQLMSYSAATICCWHCCHWHCCRWHCCRWHCCRWHCWRWHCCRCHCWRWHCWRWHCCRCLTAVTEDDAADGLVATIGIGIIGIGTMGIGTIGIGTAIFVHSPPILVAVSRIVNSWELALSIAPAPLSSKQQ